MNEQEIRESIYYRHFQDEISSFMTNKISDLQTSENLVHFELILRTVISEFNRQSNQILERYREDNTETGSLLDRIHLISYADKLNEFISQLEQVIDQNQFP